MIVLCRIVSMNCEAFFNDNFVFGQYYGCRNTNVGMHEKTACK